MKQVDGLLCNGGCGSPPVRGRGLKHFIENHADQRLVSPPVRGRGLKLCYSTGCRPNLGRPPCGGVD